LKEENDKKEKEERAKRIALRKTEEAKRLMLEEIAQKKL